MFIEIIGKDFKLPFSAGVLANSLETVGIEFYKSHNISQKIREQLKNEDIGQISRKELKERVFRLLEKEEGEKMASKYMKFRKIMQLKKPLVILLGGSTGSGKNTVSLELAHRLDIMTVITTDIIRELMRSLFSDEILPVLHSSSYLAHKKLWMRLKENKNREIIAFKEQSLRVNAGIKSIIKRSIKENTSLIINGVHILSDFLNKEDFKNACIVKVFIYVKNKEEHKKRFYIRGLASEQRVAKGYLDNFNTIRLIQNYIIKKAKNERYLCINNLDSKETALQIIDHIIEKVELKIG